MTAYRLRSKGKAPKASNKKDGGPRRSSLNWGDYGFNQEDWNAHTYTWEGVFPQFCIAPGIIEGQAGLVARCDNPETLILFPYGTSPEDIKGRLDDEILEIMRLDAALVDAPLVDEEEEIDIDEYMADLNASADDRLLYRRPAVQELAGHYGLTIHLGLEIYLERGE